MTKSITCYVETSGLCTNFGLEGRIFVMALKTKAEIYAEAVFNLPKENGLCYVNCSRCKRPLMRVSDCIGEVICPDCRTTLVFQVKEEQVSIMR